MDIKNVFKHGRKISPKAFRENYRKSKATQGFLGKKEISEILDRENEKGEFNKLLREKSKGGLERVEMQKAIGEMKTLTETERRRLAKEIFPYMPSDQRIIRSKNSSTKNQIKRSYTSDRTKNNDSLSDNTKMTPQKMALVMNRTRTKLPSSLDSKETESKKPSFFDAMQSVRRNKQS